MKKVKINRREIRVTKNKYMAICFEIANKSLKQPKIAKTNVA